MSLAAKTVSGKILAIFFPVMAFVAMGFDHVVANMFFIPAAIWAGVPDIGWGDAIVNWLPGAGNLVGAVIFVATSYWYLFLRDQPDTVTAAEEPAERAWDDRLLGASRARVPLRPPGDPSCSTRREVCRAHLAVEVGADDSRYPAALLRPFAGDGGRVGLDRSAWWSRVEAASGWTASRRRFLAPHAGARPSASAVRSPGSEPRSHGAGCRSRLHSSLVFVACVHMGRRRPAAGMTDVGSPRAGSTSEKRVGAFASCGRRCRVLRGSRLLGPRVEDAGEAGEDLVPPARAHVLEGGPVLGVVEGRSPSGRGRGGCRPPSRRRHSRVQVVLNVRRTWWAAPPP